MPPHFIKRAVASERECAPLSLNLFATAKNGLADCVSEIFDEIVSQLTDTGFCVTHYKIAGQANGNKIWVYNDSEGTRLHEKTHQELHGVWPQPDRSFTEGWAFAIPDYVFNGNKDSPEVVLRRNMSLALCSFHSHYNSPSETSSNGKLSERDTRDLISMIKSSRLEYSDKNWAAFLCVVQNFRYYALFYDVLSTFGIEHGKNIVFESARISESTGNVMNGLNNLIYNLCKENDTRYDINTIPIWKPGLSLRKKPTVKIRNEAYDFQIVLHTHSHNAACIVGGTVKRYLKELERNGPVKKNYRKDIRPYLNLIQ